MSWQSYVDDQLLNTKMVTHAVICGHDGNVWATSANFSVRNPEIPRKILRLSEIVRHFRVHPAETVIDSSLFSVLFCHFWTVKIGSNFSVIFVPEFEFWLLNVRIL